MAKTYSHFDNRCVLTMVVRVVMGTRNEGLELVVWRAVKMVYLCHR